MSTPAELAAFAEMLRDLFDEVEATVLTIGIQADEGAAAASSKTLKRKPAGKVDKNPNPYKGDPAKTELGDTPTTIEIAVANHYGTRKIPPRPWLEQTADKYGDGWLEAWDFAINKVIDGAPSGTYERVLRQIAVVGVADAKQVLTDLRDPPNAPFTVAMKGSDNPLIDTGHLRESHRAELTIGSLREVVA